MNTTEQVKKSLAKRYKKEKRFKFIGLVAVIMAFIFLCLLLTDIVGKSIPAFTQYSLKVDVNFDKKILGISDNDEESLQKASYRNLTSQTIYALFPEVTRRADKTLLKKLISSEATFQLKEILINNPSYLGTTQTVNLFLDDDVDTFIKSGGLKIKTDSTNRNARLRDQQVTWIKTLADNNKINKHFNTQFFTGSDSREPEVAGIKGAVIGTVLTILVTICLSLPIGLAAALYLEEFAPKNKLTDIIEININNLAAVPSIVFGLLGLAVFINLFGLPRSAPIVGGLVLTLMTLPTIIISSRAAIKAVPPSLKEAALGLGASHTQTVFHQVLPQAMPGVLTGTIIGIAQAIGETAPLLMIGMVAFIVDIPNNLFDPATVLPVQIYIWADSPERAFVAKTSAAILILLILLICINLMAVYLRKKFERKW